MANGNMHKAKTAKNDEFYTQLSDIEKELQHYEDQFKDKVIYLNCDDYRSSQFFVYFKNNFDRLELKKVIAVHYEANGNSTKTEITRDED
tara:strand:- start:348 stop:617 length:270 start_codon:yes stop_codon:yes gene_type:complete